MKAYFYKIFFLLSGIPGMLSAQHILQSELNLPRSGDEIVKQQVEYKDPGRSGENVLWDFGELKPVNDEYTLSYSEPVLVQDSIDAQNSFYILGLDTIRLKDLSHGSLLMGAEHYTTYYYYLTGNRLWVLGHENPTALLRYNPSLLAGFYPMRYQDSCLYDYQAEGIYSSTVPFTSGGEVQIKADAYGMMILPSGDTLRNVLRTHAMQTIRQTFSMGGDETVEQSSSIETCKWYSKGYRYPIFETLRSTLLTDSTETVNFETAFFFPPQEHYYLEEDPENLALQEEEADRIFDPWAGLTYNIYPNPVKNAPLEVELYLPRPADIRIQLRNTLGLVQMDQFKGSFPIGVCRFLIDAYTLTVGNYILDIWLNEKLISEIILKRSF
ncbi:MAG: T9SS C-terminal target domain-containing protein [Candidatus Azobacteroides sp.]|nr:T9SS C-terminal target domain-containing protein [Candidatus Azobacteroides sp.]